MTQILRCSQGHSWQSSAGPAADGNPPACPSCGDHAIGTQADYPETIAAPIDADLEASEVLPTSQLPPQLPRSDDPRNESSSLAAAGDSQPAAPTATAQVESSGNKTD